MVKGTLKKIEGQRGLYRDTETGAIVNRDMVYACREKLRAEICSALSSAFDCMKIGLIKDRPDVSAHEKWALALETHRWLAERLLEEERNLAVAMSVFFEDQARDLENFENFRK